MKKPHWLEKENLYRIMFESEHPAGRISGTGNTGIYAHLFLYS